MMINESGPDSSCPPHHRSLFPFSQFLAFRRQEDYTPAHPRPAIQLVLICGLAINESRAGVEDLPPLTFFRVCFFWATTMVKGLLSSSDGLRSLRFEEKDEEEGRWVTEGDDQGEGDGGGG